MILSLDKIARLIFSYAKARLKSSVSLAIASRETVVPGRLQQEPQRFQQQFEAGVVPSLTATRPMLETAGDIPLQLQEAEDTLKDLSAGEDAEAENHPQKQAQPGLSPPFSSRTPLAIRDTYNSRQRSPWQEWSVTCSTQRSIITGFTRCFTRR